jgi:hypothetical protein
MRFSWPMGSAARRIIAVDDGDSEEADAVLDHYDLPSSPGTASTGAAADLDRPLTNLRCNRMAVDPIDLISADEDDDDDDDDKDSSEDEFDHHRQLLTDVSSLSFNLAKFKFKCVRCH